MIALVAAMVALAVALVLNARQTYLSRTEQRESEARIIAAFARGDAAARNVAARWQG